MAVDMDFKDEELKQLKELKLLNKDFLQSTTGSVSVRKYLEEASEKDDLLLRFLRGRKYNGKRAWETLKHYAEVRFDIYPEVFPQNYPVQVHALRENPILGVLKHRDSLGRRIMVMNAADWNPEEYSLEILTIASIVMIEKLLLDDDGLSNGIVYIQQCSGVGMKQAQQYTLRAMRRLVSVFWYAFPLQIKGLYFVNVPTILSCAFAMLHILGPGTDYQNVYTTISLDTLPKCLGGTLELQDAIDNSFLTI
ncbi:Retinaldehyde-binding protein 1 [Orchesella cincta]|uniref:Retinaldehyde-binding protein 1 n=1 Tax=Orchesella cincta TaxID=48709 RepID=A0A1D2MGW8_ORCCI|nr:Retinaldehyde-binding protein 1 [Orchesella cincta]